MAGMCKLHSFASSVMAIITDCEINMSNLQQGYKWMKSFVFLKTRDRKKAQVHLVANHGLLPPQCGAEFGVYTSKREQLSCVLYYLGEVMVSIHF